MARRRACPNVSLGPARTTLGRDACRATRKSRFLKRGGRPRRSDWWRAWVARLLPVGSDAAAPVVVSASLKVSTKVLTLTFDASIDAAASDVHADQISVTDGVQVFLGASFVDVVGAVIRVQMDLPGSVPLEMTCALAPLPGAIRGIGGSAVAPFGGLPVANT